MVVLLKGFPLSTENHWNSVRVAIGFLATSLTKTLLPRSLSLSRRPVLGRVLAGCKLLPYTEDRGHCADSGPSMLQKFFFTLAQICVSIESWLGGLKKIPWTSWLGLCSDMHCYLWDLI